MRKAEVFVLSSLWEELGFVIVEQHLIIYLLYQVIAQMDQVILLIKMNVEFYLIIIQKTLLKRH